MLLFILSIYIYILMNSIYIIICIKYINKFINIWIASIINQYMFIISKKICSSTKLINKT